MRLKKGQKAALLTWIAEGLESVEINQRADKFKPRFKVSKTQIAHYRKSRQLTLKDIQQAAEVDALKSGLALKDNRVGVLQRLADRFVTELLPENGSDDKLWLLQVKGIGGQDNFERIEYYDFNKAEVDSLRGVLDDIAAEVGHRIKKTDVTSGGEKINTLTPEQIAEKVNDLLKLANERKSKDAG